MYKYRQNIITGVTAIAIFVIACFIYVSNRNGNMVLYSWLRIDFNNEFISFLRQRAPALPDWVKYNIPDGLWLLSYMLFMDAIWQSEVQIKRWFLCPIIIIAFLFELLQYLELLSGTGDILDILCYLVAIILYLLQNKLKQIYYEKLN